MYLFWLMIFIFLWFLQIFNKFLWNLFMILFNFFTWWTLFQLLKWFLRKMVELLFQHIIFTLKSNVGLIQLCFNHVLFRIKLIDSHLKDFNFSFKLNLSHWWLNDDLCRTGDSLRWHEFINTNIFTTQLNIHSWTIINNFNWAYHVTHSWHICMRWTLDEKWFLWWSWNGWNLTAQ